MREGENVLCHLAPGSTDEYVLDLEAGQFLHLSIHQKGVDVVSTLSDPTDEEIIQADGPTADQGSETLLVVAEHAGSHVLRVKAWDKEDSGDYTLELRILRSASDLDRRRSEAARVFSDAEVLRGKRGSEVLPGKKRELAQAAVRKYEEALGLFQALRDRQGEASALRGLGRLARAQGGQREAAVDYFRRALLILKEVQDDWMEASISHSLGMIYVGSGEIGPAVELFEAALELRQKLGRHQGAARSSFELGKLHQQVGHVQEGLTYLELALEHWLQLGEKTEIAVTYFQRGELFFELGRYREALDDYQMALSIWRESGNYEWQILALQAINQAYRQQGHLELALDALEQAWEPLREFEDSSTEASLWNETGLLFLEAGRHEEAFEVFEKALDGFRDAEDQTAQAVVTHNVGKGWLDLGEPCEAIEYYKQARQLFDAVLGKTAMNSQRALTSMYRAKAERLCRGPENARPYFEGALEVLEQLRSRTASLDYRSSYLASYHWIFDEYVDLLMELHSLNPTSGYDSLALAISERARARSLLDGLITTEAEFRHGADPELIRAEQELEYQLQAIERRSLRSPLATDGSGNFDEYMQSAQSKTRDLLRSLDDIRSRIRLENPRFDSLLQAHPLDPEEIRERVLDPETILLEYDLGKERSYLWALTTEGLISHELPPRAEVEQMAREAYDLLKLSKRRRSMKRVEMALAELGKVLLAPVAELLQGSQRRLLVVSEGALQYIPFAALTLPWTNEPLILEHEVVNMPSASAVAILRERVKSRDVARKSLAVIADPVFQSHDPRVGGEALAGKRTDAEIVLRAEADSHERLIHAQQEAEAASQYFAESQIKKLLAFDATREAVFGGDLGDYRIVHFATHGVLDEEHPGLSHLVLSLVDQLGRQREAGFLFGHEIYNLDLPVELVVLSACETALGKEILGEGLVGLTQSFFSAGAARVLVSLWKVDDHATAELMSRFYFYMIEKELQPSVALRQAQIEMLKETSAPYYWTPFILRGEWR